ncbi:carboxylesterase family protein [Streptomyces olivoreticuli]
MSSPSARIASGAVHGRRAGSLAIFKGMPYARPPVGQHRFQAPVEAEPWEGLREALRYGPRPPQVPLIPGEPPWTEAEGTDWLSANVWTPDLGGAGLPVMVWIHGGGYQSGSADQPDYDAALLAGLGVVVVTFNYRLGLEGFAQITGAPPNRGLLDQIAALHWVQENITAFGGDPGQVTIFGESAGGGSVASLMVAPSARGLFRRAIVQSASRHFLSESLAHRIGKAIAHRLGAAPTVDGLASRPIEKTIEACSQFIAEDLVGEQVELWLARIAFAPVVDGHVLPQTPWTALSVGAADGVDLIAGFTADEYRLFSTVLGTAEGMTDEAFSATASALAPPGADAAYRQALPGATPMDRTARLLSDALFRMPVAHLADAHQDAGGTTYAYELAWPVPGFDGALRACHGLDIPLTFGTLDTPFMELLLGGSAEARATAEELSRSIRTSWTAFAATGDPGWPRYDPRKATTRVYDTEITDIDNPEADSRRLWANHTFAPLR